MACMRHAILSHSFATGLHMNGSREHIHALSLATSYCLLYIRLVSFLKAIIDTAFRKKYRRIHYTVCFSIHPLSSDDKTLFYFYLFFLFRLDLDDRLDLDQSIQRQSVGTDGTTGVIADGLVKDLHDYVGAAVHDLVMELEVRRRVDNSKDLLVMNSRARMLSRIMICSKAVQRISEKYRSITNPMDLLSL